MTTGRSRRARRGHALAALLLGVVSLVSLTGCSLIAGDLADDEVEAIPAALLASDTGVRITTDGAREIIDAVNTESS